MFVSKKKYQSALDQIEHLETSLAQAQNLKFVFERITERLESDDIRYHDLDGSAFGAGVSMDDITELIKSDEDIAVYVSDHFGGKVIKQQATPVTVLDAEGKATYAHTAEKPDKGRSYKLVQN